MCKPGAVSTHRPRVERPCLRIYQDQGTVVFRFYRAELCRVKQLRMPSCRFMNKADLKRVYPLAACPNKAPDAIRDLRADAFALRKMAGSPKTGFRHESPK